MSSLQRTLASRANGARSRGPTTPEGKARSSQNALRHGLLAKYVVLANESPEGFADLHAQYIAVFNPASGVEEGLVEEMVVACWRLRRLWAIETRTLDDALAVQPPGDELGRIKTAFSGLAGGPELFLIHRYETRLHTCYQRALHNFLLLRTAGMPNEPTPIDLHPQLGPALLPPPGGA